MNCSEQEIIQRCIKGDRKAHNHLYNVYKVKMYGLCLRYAKSKEEAEDFLLAGFQKVFRDLKQFNQNSTLSSWIRRVMINNALGELRKKNRVTFINSEPINPEHFRGIEPTIISQLNADEIIGLIQRLPIGYQTIFNLFAIEGYSHKEIADTLQISESTSRSQYTRAKKALQQLIIQRELV